MNKEEDRKQEGGEEKWEGMTEAELGCGCGKAITCDRGIQP